MAEKIDLPPVPPSPKIAKLEPLKTTSLSDTRTIRPTAGESMSIDELHRDTRGPIGSKRQVEHDVGRETERRYQQENALERKRRRVWSRPYQLRGGKR